MKTLFKWIGRSLLLAVALFVLLQVYFFVAIGWWRYNNPSSTSFMRARLETLREANPHAQLQQHWVPYAAISDNLKAAVITSEDGKFAEHEGVDWQAVEKAYENNKKKGKKIKGGSTITQQLAKNLFLSGERTYARKAQELVITFMLEFWLPKQRILEIYLNVVEWGNGLFGADAAARHYFGIPASQLSEQQAATLASMLPNPRFYDTHRASGYLAQRAQTIMRWMPDAELP